MWNWFKKWFKGLFFLEKISVIFVAAVLYINIGILFNYYANYAFYYQTSTAAKVLIPTAPCDFVGDSPFSSSTPQICERLKVKYGSFKNYLNEDKFSTFLLILIWPVYIVIFYFASITSWIIWIAVWIFKFLFMGGMLKLIGLLPS